MSQEEPKDTQSPGAGPVRGYAGVRITAPPRRAPAVNAAATAAPRPEDMVDRERQARILTGSALLGVLATVLVHELGHWAVGFAVTGMAPEFYAVAVRQKTSALSTSGGVLVWGAGPVFQLAVIWAMVLLMPVAGRFSTRLASAAGAALVISMVLAAVTWGFAATSVPADWGDDLPKVASFMASEQRLWMNLLEGAFTAAVLAAFVRWIWLMRRSGRIGAFAGPVAIGAAEGGTVVLIGAWLATAMM